MPGIAGIISKTPKKKNERDLSLMTDCMMHEPFYRSGTYVNEKLGLYAGWVCYKGSFSDCMPVQNERKDLILLFVGENFIDREVINRLKSRGHEFDCSNATYLIHLYEEDQDGFLKTLNGWFQGIIVDLQKERVLFFNDRYGMQRIYYHESEDAFLFSSEAKSLLRVRPELRKINLQSLGEFFTCDCILQNRTLFSNLFLLPGGSAWTFCNGTSVKRDFYFQPSTWENQPRLEKKVFYNRLRETFLNLLPNYFRTDEPMAMSLTSGLDTRVIMACLADAHPALPCYTFGGMNRDSFDIQIARKVANACQRTHHVVRLDGKFLSDFPGLAEKTIYTTDGCLDVCSTHDIYFNSVAREIAPIRMTGKFGSEVLASQSMLRKPVALSQGLFHPDFTEHLNKALGTFTSIRKGNGLSFAVFKEMPWREYGRLAIEMSKVILRTPYMDNDLVKLMYQAPTNTRDSSCNRSHYSLSLFPDYITNLEVNERRVLSEAAC